MRWTRRRLAAIALCGMTTVAWAGNARALAQATQPPPPAQPRVESQITIVAEPFCSDTRVRMSSARIRWSMPRAALDQIGLATVAAARQSLEATVYKNGFEKGLLVALPIGPATAERPVVPQAQAQGRPPLPRAFQIRLVGIEQPRAAESAATDTGVVIENLEPGVNYTVRVAIEPTAGRMVSPGTRFQARICPADLETSTAPRRRR